MKMTALVAALVATSGLASAESLTVRELDDRVEITAPGLLLAGQAPAAVDGWVTIELSGKISAQSVKLSDSTVRQVTVQGGSRPVLRIDIRGGQTKTRRAAARTWARYAEDDGGLVIVVPRTRAPRPEGGTETARLD